MKKFSKKVVASLLCLLMLFGYLPVTISASAVTAYDVLDRLAQIDASGYTWGSYGNLKPGSNFTDGECWQYVLGLSRYVFNDNSINIPATNTYLSTGNQRSYYRVAAALKNCTYDQIAAYLKKSQPGDIVGLKNSKTNQTYGHIIFIGNNTGSKITVYQAYSGKVYKQTVDLTAEGLKYLGSFGYSGSASFQSENYGVALFRCNSRTGQSDFVYTYTDPEPSNPGATVLSISSSSVPAGSPVTLSWTAVANVTNYWIDGYKNGEKFIAEIDNSRSRVMYLDEGSYRFIVTTINSANKKTLSNEVRVTVYNNTPSYSLYFNANGGSGVPSAVTRSGSGNVTIPSTTPTRTGYTFGGWFEFDYFDEICKLVYNPGQSYYLSESTTLYADWSPKSYTITYSASGATNVPSAQQFYYGDGVKISSTVPSKSGYRFVGWSTVSGSSNASYYSGFNYSFTGNTTLYAVWEVATYSGDGDVDVTIQLRGTGMNETRYSYTVNESGVYKVYMSPTGMGDPTYYGCIPEDSNGHSVNCCAPSDELKWGSNSSYNIDYYYFTPGTYNLLLYVFNVDSAPTCRIIIGKIDTSVSFNANGGSGAPSKLSDNYQYTIPSTVPTRSGYKFLGWSKSSTATSAEYAAGDKIKVSSKTVLYAVWAKNEFTLTFDANGGTGAPAAIKGSGTVKLPSAVPTRSGYLFVCWGIAPDVTTNTGYSAGYASYNLNANKTLYAVWSKAYTLKYDANEGTGAPESQEFSELTGFLVSTTEPVRNGYKFLGWSVRSYDPQPVCFAGKRYTYDKNLTLYAIWEKTSFEKYTITYNANGGTGAPSSQTKIEDTDINLSSVTPVRKGYIFEGWGLKRTDVYPYYYPGDIYSKNESVTFYAVWDIDPEESNIIFYFSMGGTGGPDIQYKIKDTECKISSSVPTKDGYKFLGWTDISDESSVIYRPGDSFVKNEDTFLFAVWEEEKSTEESSIRIIGYREQISLDYRTTITFRCEYDYRPADADIYWAYGDNNGRAQLYKSETLTLKEMTSNSAVQVIIASKDGSTIYSQSEIELIYVNNGFFARLIAFFKALFGLLPIVEQK